MDDAAGGVAPKKLKAALPTLATGAGPNTRPEGHPESSPPLVSIGLTTHNRAAMLAECLESVLGQDYRNLEVIVSDNMSSDRTGDVVSSFHDPRIRYVRSSIPMTPDGELSQVPLDLASGVYYKPQADDDKMEPSCISRCVRLFEEHPDVVVVLLGTQEFGGRTVYRPPAACDGKRVLIGDDRDVALPSIQAIPIGANMFRRKVALDVGGYRNLGHGAWSPDFDLLVRLIDAGSVGVIDLPLFLERVHAGQERFLRQDHWRALLDNAATLTWYLNQAPDSPSRRSAFRRMVRQLVVTWGQRSALEALAGRTIMWTQLWALVRRGGGPAEGALLLGEALEAILRRTGSVAKRTLRHAVR